jgi:hypothetical protein
MHGTLRVHDRLPTLISGLLPAADFDKGIADLYRALEEDGVFCYTFFKATARL